MNSAESLYSLEVYIQDVSNLVISCGVPAISFRFLDYPSVIIYMTQLHELEQLKDKIKTCEQDCEKELKKLKNQYDSYEFCKGKSCLFKKSFTDLKLLLTELPLYMTLIDCLLDHPKLLGLCSVPLLSLIQKIEKKTSETFEDAPMFSRENFSVSLCNLMGSKVAQLNMSIKLVCFGSSLLRHVTVQDKRDTQINLMVENVFGDGLMKKQKALEIVQENTYKEHTEHYIIPADGLNKFNNKELPIEKKNKGCQFPRENRKKYIKEDKRNTFYSPINQRNEDYFTNTFQPPPLFLNLNENTYSPERVPEKIQTSKYLLEARFDDEIDEIFSDQEPYVETLVPWNDNSKFDRVKDVKEISEAGQLMENEHEQNIKTIKKHTSNMPVLCTLLKEIAQLNNFINGQGDTNEKYDKGKYHEVNSIPQKSKVKTQKSVKIAKPLPIHLKMKRNDHNFLDTGNKFETDKRKLVKNIKNTDTSIRPNKHTIKKQAKRISYGLTKTQRLRYAITHDGDDPLFCNGWNRKDKRWTGKVSAIRNETSGANNDQGELDAPEDLQDEIVTLEEETKEQRPMHRIEIKMPMMQDDNVSVENESVPNVSMNGHSITPVSEAKVGFHSPVEPREITWSDLGEFNDTQPWNSAEVILHDDNDQKDGNFYRSYSEESFASDNDDDAASEKRNATITATSSVSLPQASGSESNPTKPPSNDSRLVASPVLSDFSPQRTRSSSRLATSTSSYRKDSHISPPYKEKPRTLTKDLKNHSDNSSNSSLLSSSSLSTTSSSSIDSSLKKTSSSSSSSATSSTRIVNVPRHSAYSPVKSTYKKQISGGEELATNTALDVTIPSV